MEVTSAGPVEKRPSDTEFGLNMSSVNEIIIRCLLSSVSTCLFLFFGRYFWVFVFVVFGDSPQTVFKLEGELLCPK